MECNTTIKNIKGCLTKEKGEHVCIQDTKLSEEISESRKCIDEKVKELLKDFTNAPIQIFKDILKSATEKLDGSVHFQKAQKNIKAEVNEFREIKTNEDYSQIEPTGYRLVDGLRF
ncbi:hypothetical protein HZS_1863 [Henneguya salminicola]|nr:hypothetical protein HZS_1863 [Henneguya salminicola]